MEFKKLEKQLLATAKAFRAFKTEFGYGKSGEELLKPFFRSLEESLGAFETAEKSGKSLRQARRLSVGDFKRGVKKVCS